jgi:hypothetical protein
MSLPSDFSLSEKLDKETLLITYNYLDLKNIRALIHASNDWWLIQWAHFWTFNYLKAWWNMGQYLKNQKKLNVWHQLFSKVHGPWNNRTTWIVFKNLFFSFLPPGQEELGFLGKGQWASLQVPSPQGAAQPTRRRRYQLWGIYTVQYISDMPYGTTHKVGSILF